jgi:hypothetical protein
MGLPEAVFIFRRSECPQLRKICGKDATVLSWEQLHKRRKKLTQLSGKERMLRG